MKFVALFAALVFLVSPLALAKPAKPDQYFPGWTKPPAVRNGHKVLACNLDFISEKQGCIYAAPGADGVIDCETWAQKRNGKWERLVDGLLKAGDGFLTCEELPSL